MVLDDKITILKRRLKTLGPFADDESLSRLKDSFINSMMLIWTKFDFDFKNSTASLVTTDGTLGPYNAPSDFERFAQTFRVYYFKYGRSKSRIEPIKDSEDPYNNYDLYYNVEDGKLYFFEDPGAATLTLNYQGYVDPDITDLATTLTAWPEGMWHVLQEFIIADILEDIPGMRPEFEAHEAKGLRLLRDYIDDATMTRSNTKTITPQGLHGNTIDGICELQ